MSKSLKIILIIFVILMVVSSYSFATGIDMNLPYNDEIQQNTSSTTTKSNTISSSSDNSTSSDNELDENDIDEDEDDISTESSTGKTSNQYTTISSVSGATDDGISADTILNILLIVVGVVLILLAVAILIKLKG